MRRLSPFSTGATRWHSFSCMLGTGLKLALFFYAFQFCSFFLRWLQEPRCPRHAECRYLLGKATVEQIWVRGAWSCDYSLCFSKVALNTKQARLQTLHNAHKFSTQLNSHRRTTSFFSRNIMTCASRKVCKVYYIQTCQIPRV